MSGGFAGHFALGGRRQNGGSEEVCVDVQPADKWAGRGPGHQPQLCGAKPLRGRARSEAQGDALFNETITAT